MYLCWTKILEIELFWYLNCVLMLNWIVWNRTVFDMKTVLTRIVFDVETVLTLNWIVWIKTVWLNWIAWNRKVFSQLNCVLMLNWIVWNRTVYLYKYGLIYHKTQTTNNRGAGEGDTLSSGSLHLPLIRIL